MYLIILEIPILNLIYLVTRIDLLNETNKLNFSFKVNSWKTAKVWNLKQNTVNNWNSNNP